jgi:hypothetical protein
MRRAILLEILMHDAHPSELAGVQLRVRGEKQNARREGRTSFYNLKLIACERSEQETRLAGYK